MAGDMSSGSGTERERDLRARPAGGAFPVAPPRPGRWLRAGAAGLCLLLALQTARAQDADPEPAARMPTAPVVEEAPAPAPAYVPTIPPIGLFQETLAAALAEDPALFAWYAERAYAPLWTGAEDAGRRAAFLTALSYAPEHGLPAARYGLEALVARFHEVMGERDRALLEVEMTRRYLSYGRDIASGALAPARVDPGIVRSIHRPDPVALLAGIAGPDPAAWLAGLPPHSAQYASLLREKARLEGARPAAPGLGGETLRPGQSGARVAALRAALAQAGYRPGRGQEYDAALALAVRTFQADRGLAVDGIAGPGTLAALGGGEAEGATEARWQAVVTALERERWMNYDLGPRHIWVNLTDFLVRVVDEGRVTFETRAVIGKNDPETRTPEFSELMTYMVVNPSWHVPRSITTREYLPQLQRNPHAVAHIQVVDRAGNVVDRGSVDFTQFSAKSFPFSMRQTPGTSNALGRVKFMFPNKWNIYLHDTPSKKLFNETVRAFSHGCIRLQKPFDLAYVLLQGQSADPEGYFQRLLDSGKEVTVRFKEPVPVHLDYRTAYADASGRIVYRADVYGRDARIFEALRKAGVELPGVQG